MIYFSILLSPLFVRKNYFLCIPAAAAVLLTVWCCSHIQTMDTEYWGGNVTSAAFEEPWDETVPCSHIKYCTDSKGNSTPCGTDHAYDVVYHPAKYRLTDTNDIVKSISKTEYSSILWPESFKDMHRNFHTIDGDKYLKIWDGSRDTAKLLTTKHTYQNRIALATEWPEVDASGLFEYSEESIQGAPNGALDWFNGYYGPILQVRAIVLVFKDQPLSRGFDQQSYWKNGNKNEFVICIGTTDVVQWVHVFSWTENRELVSDASTWVKIGQPVDIPGLALKIEQELPQRWSRKQFHDFDWVMLDPPWWAYILAVIVSISVSAGSAAAVEKYWA